MAVSDVDKWRVQMLGMYGGFGHKYIAREVFGNEGAVSQVRHILYSAGIKVSEWRRGETAEAQEYVGQTLGENRRRGRGSRRRSSRRTRRRAA